MKTLSPGLRSHLDSGATTLCHCWKLTTRENENFGFTDHDRDLVIDGVTYEAMAGFTASEIESSLGLAVDNLDASGALSSDALSEARLRAGDFDHAEIEIWRVNWQDASQRVLMRKGHLGEVTHGGVGFTAEMRGLSHLLNQPKGRLYKFGCDAVLGDARCGVDLDDVLFQGVATVIESEQDRRLTVSGLGSFSDGWFARGTVEWTSGGNAGRIGEVKFHRVAGAEVVIELWQGASFAVSPGDTFAIRAGCDKQFSTCKTKFANGVNFRGFPHMPGDDFVLTYARRDDPSNDGGSLGA